MRDERAEAAYLGLRHFQPEAVRLVRAALDNGCMPAELKRCYAGRNADRFRFAVEHMAAHPEAGRLVWCEGEYQFAEFMQGRKA